MEHEARLGPGHLMASTRLSARVTPDLDRVVRRFGYRQICAAILCAAVLMAIGFSVVFFHTLTGTVPAGVAVVASLTALCVAAPIIAIVAIIIQRLDRMGRAVRDQARTLDQRNAALAAAEEALRDSNAILETRVRERTGELDAARRAAERLNADKTLFLASMSHELRTPLNAIIGFSDMLVSRREIFGSDSPERVDEYGAVIRKAGRHLLALVNDLLDMSRIECGQTDLTPECVDIREAVSDAAALLERQAAERGQTIVVNLDAAPPCIEADARAMQQILANLLSNALKFSPEGAPVVLSVAEDGEGTVFTVADRGPGMSETEAREAIRPFSRMSKAHVTAGKSIGLGLPIVDALVRMHGGSLSFEAGAGAGTVARVHVPRPDEPMFCARVA